MKKIKLIIILQVIILIIASTVVNAGRDPNLNKLIKESEEFIKEGNNYVSENSYFNMDKLKVTSDFVYSTLFILALSIDLIVGTILGVQFLGASVEGKAKIKETLVPYVVGSIIVFGSYGIWKLIIMFGNKIT